VNRPSVLFEHELPPLADEAPAFFRDLNLDQFVAAVTTGRDEYELAPYFHTPLRTEDEVAYRHEALRDLEEPAVREHVEAFALRMHAVREQLARTSGRGYALQQQRWFLDAARVYVQAVAALTDGLMAVELRSRAMGRIRDFLVAYADSEAVAALTGDERDVRERLGEVRYTLEIDGLRIKVARYEHEDDYGAQVAATFAKFKLREAKDYRAELPQLAEMNHIEASVLKRVGQLYPETFAALADFCEHHRDFLDDTMAAFDREVQFYLALLEFTRRLEGVGLRSCLPEVSETPNEVSAREAFDVALAAKLIDDRSHVVTNDFALSGEERVFVVSGPNQGGKTTFARTFGQMHHLARLGCPVPGNEARLSLCDEIFTHFEKEETLEDLSGKLQDDLLRVRNILERVSSRSVVILNEIFTSTTLDDATFLGIRILRQLIERDVLCVCVTFVEELASLDEHVVSMVSTVDPDDPSIRTFKVLRRPADGRSYAIAIAKKHGLTYERLSERIAA
jgi:DNA mismatch repair protein MutS